MSILPPWRQQRFYIRKLEFTLGDALIDVGCGQADLRYTDVPRVFTAREKQMAALFILYCDRFIRAERDAAYQAEV